MGAFNFDNDGNKIKQQLPKADFNLSMQNYIQSIKKDYDGMVFDSLDLIYFCNFWWSDLIKTVSEQDSKIGNKIGNFVDMFLNTLAVLKIVNIDEFIEVTNQDLNGKLQDYAIKQKSDPQFLAGYAQAIKDFNEEENIEEKK